MGYSKIYGVPAVVFFSLLVLSSAALSQKQLQSSSSYSINSNSILVALLDSHYTELAELVEKALLLPTLEAAVAAHNLTIFAPRNDALDRSLDPSFKQFLLQPANLPSLQALLLAHFLPSRLPSPSRWSRRRPLRLPSLSSDPSSPLTLSLSSSSSAVPTVDNAAVILPDDIARPDGVIHGIDRLLVPRSVQEGFNRRRSLREIAAVKPEGAPAVDPRTHRLRNPAAAAAVPAGAPPLLPIYDAMAPGPLLAPAPAPGPGAGHRHFDGESHVRDFIQTLVAYGGYNEMADILVNLTSLGSEIGRLVSEGYVLTVLAPNDEAMAALTTEQLSEPGAPEDILYYHIIPEYQTEESMYNAVRRFQSVVYETLRVPHRLEATEADGSVRFGKKDSGAYLFDPDIYVDGRISVQGIDRVMFPEVEKKKEEEKPRAKAAVKKVVKQRRGKLLEVACSMLGAFGQYSHFTSCQ